MASRLANEYRSIIAAQSLEAALKARELILKFTTFQVSQDEFVDGLACLGAGQAIRSNWELFTGNEELYPCLEIYQIIDSLSTDLDYQLQFYGYDSLKQDTGQLDISINILKRFLGKDTFDKDKYFQFIKKQFNGGM